MQVTYTGDPIIIDKEALKEYCGQAPFAKDRFYESTPAGVVMGLAWTSMGGATLYVEAARVHDSEAKGALTTTGAWINLNFMPVECMRLLSVD